MTDKGLEIKARDMADAVGYLIEIASSCGLKDIAARLALIRGDLLLMASGNEERHCHFFSRTRH